MSALHKLTIVNPTGDAVLTRVHLDGVEQFVSAVTFRQSLDVYGGARAIEATLAYPMMAVEVTLEGVEPQRRYHARLFIPGYEGVSEVGDGESVAGALHDLASRCEAR